MGPRPKNKNKTTAAAATTATATATATTATATATATTATTIATAAAAERGKRGVGVWWFPGVGAAMAPVQSACSWLYNWRPTPEGVPVPTGVEFVPMIWGPDHMQSLATVAATDPRAVLTFNEPDNSTQSNMTPAAALQAWPKLQAAFPRARLGSPGAANDATAGWMQTFMAKAAAKGLRVDFVCVHLYPDTTKDPDAALAKLEAHLAAVHAKYRKPIWVTEFALMHWTDGGADGGGGEGATAVFPTPADQARFASGARALLERLPYVERYAWFSASKYTSTPEENSMLFTQGGALTPTGAAYLGV